MCFPLLNLSWRWEHALGPRVRLPICDLRCVFRSWNWIYGESMPYGTLTYLRLAICLPFMNLNWRWEHAHLIGNRNPTTCIGTPPVNETLLILDPCKRKLTNGGCHNPLNWIAVVRFSRQYLRGSKTQRDPDPMPQSPACQNSTANALGNADKGPNWKWNILRKHFHALKAGSIDENTTELTLPGFPLLVPSGIPTSLP